MKVVYTRAAQGDLDNIGQWLAARYPAVAPRVERRIRDVVARVARWPESGPRSAAREGVRVVPVSPYPYKIFYRATPDAVEILHIHHAARAPWDEPA
jgi:plasmid stabilization system protein ParE